MFQPPLVPAIPTTGPLALAFTYVQAETDSVLFEPNQVPMVACT